MDVKKDKLMLMINQKGNVEIRNHQGILIKVAYNGGDAQRADWLDEKTMMMWIQTTKGKIKHVNHQGITIRTIG